MKIHFGFKIVGITAALALAGCMTAQEDTQARASNAEKIQFVHGVGVAAAKTATASEEPGDAEITAALEALGCPRLTRLFKDYQEIDPANPDEIPSSVQEILSCLGLDKIESEEEFTEFGKKFSDPREIMDCLCGGSALSDLYNKDYLKWSTFDASVSAAAKSTFDGKSGAAGGNFGGKGSAGVSGFDGKGSIGGTFDGK